MAALSAEIIANYRDSRLASITNSGMPTSNNTVRLELALLSHLYTVAIQEWGLGLSFNPVLNIRKPSPGEGRDQRLSAEEERRLLAAVNAHSNPMLGWITFLGSFKCHSDYSGISGSLPHNADPTRCALAEPARLTEAKGEPNAALCVER